FARYSADGVSDPRFVRLAALRFVLGVFWVQQQPALPGPGVLASLFALASLAAIGFAKRAPTAVAGGATFVSFAALGLAWAAALAHARLSDRLDPELEGRDIVVAGVVAALPQAFERGVRF